MSDEDDDDTGEMSFTEVDHTNGFGMLLEDDGVIRMFVGDLCTPPLSVDDLDSIIDIVNEFLRLRMERSWNSDEDDDD